MSENTNNESQQAQRLVRAVLLMFTVLFLFTGSTMCGSDESGFSSFAGAATAMEWSPDGRWIIFSQGGRESMSLYKVAADGSGLQEILKGRGLAGDSPHSNVSASLSPDGSQVVHAAYGKPDGLLSFLEGNQWQVYSIGLAESQRRQLSSGSNKHSVSPAWSPDGTQITYLSLRSREGDNSYLEHGYRAYLLSLSDSHLEELPGNRLNPLQPQWSPDGRYFAYSAVPNGQEGTENWTLHIFDVVRSSVALTGIHGSASWGSRQQSHIGRLAWAPDSRFLVFTQLNDMENTIEFYAVDSDGTNLLLLQDFDVRGEGTGHFSLSPWKDYVTHLSWSPDGEYIAFTVNRFFDDINTGAYVMRPDGTDIRQILPLDDHDWAPHLSWSPDGSEILINSSYLVRPDGIFVSTLRDGGIAAWSPDGAQVAVYRPLKQGQRMDEAENALWIIKRDGTDQRILAWRDVRRELHLCNPQASKGTRNLTAAPALKPLGVCGGV